MVTSRPAFRVIACTTCGGVADAYFAERRAAGYARARHWPGVAAAGGLSAAPGVIPRPVSAAAASPAEWLPARYREYLLVELHMGFVAADLGQQATP
jgi:hypothetical protein